MKLGTTTHPKFRRLQKQLKLPSYAVAGLLEMLWMMASYHRGQLPYSYDEICEYIEYEGCAKELIQSLCDCKLLRVTTNGYTVIYLDRHDLKGKGWATLRRAVIERDGPNCFYCKMDCSDDITIDHLVAYSRGGTNDPSNLVVACRSCNSRKGAR